MLLEKSDCEGILILLIFGTLPCGASHGVDIRLSRCAWVITRFS
jgi:hypothetical protein